MNALRRPAPVLPFALLAAAVLAVEAWAARQVAGSPAPGVLAAAIVFDLGVALPLAYGWFVVRGRAPALRVLPAVALGLLAARLLLPAAHRGALAELHLVLIPLEVAAVAMVARGVYRSLRAAAGDPVERIREAARAVVPVRAAADAVAFEMTLLYLALFSWRARPHVPAGAAAFSGHRRSGYAGLVFAAIVASAGEALAVHLLAARWSPALAWTLTALSAYSVVWLLGDLQAVRLRPMLADADALTVRVGLRWEARIPWSDVQAVEPRGRTPFPRRAPGHLRATAMGEPTHVVVLRTPLRVRGPYGIMREATRIGVAVDDAVAFEERVRA
jgi:hypothetical protein